MQGSPRDSDAVLDTVSEVVSVTDAVPDGDVARDTDADTDPVDALRVVDDVADPETVTDHDSVLVQDCVPTAECELEREDEPLADPVTAPVPDHVWKRDEPEALPDAVPLTDPEADAVAVRAQEALRLRVPLAVRDADRVRLSVFDAVLDFVLVVVRDVRDADLDGEGVPPSVADVVPEADVIDGLGGGSPRVVHRSPNTHGPHYPLAVLMKWQGKVEVPPLG